MAGVADPIPLPASPLKGEEKMCGDLGGVENNGCPRLFV
jgi:hypothetical protein